jgi:hypothetical protein
MMPVVMMHYDVRSVLFILTLSLFYVQDLASQNFLKEFIK